MEGIVINIPEGVTARFEGLPDKSKRGRPRIYTPLKDTLLLKYLGRKDPDSLARELGVSKPSLYRRYKEITGKTIGGYE